MSTASRRLIYAIDLSRCGAKVRIHCNSLFGTLDSREFSIGDLGGFGKSRWGLETFDSASRGMLFMDMETNVHKDYPGNADLIVKIANGHFLDMKYA